MDGIGSAAEAHMPRPVQTLAVTPGDSSAWSYHRWLAHTTLQHAVCGRGGEDTRSEVRALLGTEEGRCGELIAAEKRRAEEGASALTEGGALQSGLVWPQQMAAELSSLQRELLPEVCSAGCSLVPNFASYAQPLGSVWCEPVSFKPLRGLLTCGL